MTVTGKDRSAADTAGASAHDATRTIDNYIGGSWTPSSSSEQLDVTNPATGEVLARVPLSSSADLDAAVRAAREALPAWRDVAVIARARKLFALRQGLDARREERQPVGVCGAIVPFNFPAMVPFWFLPFAIGCGNTFILKPSEQVPLTQQIAFEVLDSLDLPPGVVNLVNGGREVVEGMLDHPGIDAISFVGSAPVAKIIYERSAKAGKRVQALGGAKNHMVVMPDAIVDKTVNGIIGSAFGAAGQRCMAGSVVVTVGDAHERLLPALKEATEAVRVGDGLDEQNELGPVVSETARERILGAVERGLDEGAELLVDGRDPGLAEGCFIGATILTDVKPDMELAREEIFGPVLSLIHVNTLDEAIETVNRSRFGNGVSIFTESGAAVRRFKHDVEAGMVGVNIGVAAPVAFFPFSGWKDSFLGDMHAHGTDAVDFYTRKKTITSRYYSSGESGSYFVEN